MGALFSAVISVVVSVGVIVVLFTGANLLLNRTSQRWDDRLRPWVFVGPALAFLTIGLLIPALRTIYLSFRAGRRGDDGFTLSNFFGDRGALSFSGPNSVVNFNNVGNILTSRLFIGGILLIIVALVAARRAARKATGSGEGMDLTTPMSSGGLVLAAVLILFAVFSTLRGVLWNNLWWVVAVTGLATMIGLGLAVLADRSRSETAAKTLIFMPMAISMIGAAIIWSYMYNIQAVAQSPGFLNLLFEAAGRDQLDFLRSSRIMPWNNFFIMVIMIWIQTGFAMVVLSAAIKSVPAELTEAAKVDGANDMQVFWKITLPQIVPTIVVVATTLIITIMKVFDLVKATTNGAFGTDVLANKMYDGLRNGNFTISSAMAVIILVLVLPVMWWNFRRISREVRS